MQIHSLIVLRHGIVEPLAIPEEHHSGLGVFFTGDDHQSVAGWIHRRRHPLRAVPVVLGKLRGNRELRLTNVGDELIIGDHRNAGGVRAVRKNIDDVARIVLA